MTVGAEMKKTEGALSRPASSFKEAESSGAFDGGGGACAYSAVQRAFVNGLDAGIVQSEAVGCFGYDTFDLFAKLVGHGAVERDVDAFRFGRENLDENVAGFQRAGLCLLHGHEENGFQVEDVRFTFVAVRRGV